MKFFRFLIFVILLSAGSVAVAKELLISSPTGISDLTRYLSQYRDDTSALDIEDVIEVQDSSWQTLEHGSRQADMPEGTIWYKTTIHSGQMQEDAWILDLKNGFADEVHIYLVSGGEVIQAMDAGTNVNFNARIISHRNLIFPLGLGSHSVVDLYLRTNARESLIFPIELTPKAEFLKLDQKLLLFLSINIGLAIAMLVYNLLNYLANRHVASLYCAAIALSSAFILAGINGISYQFIWSDAPLWHSISHWFFGSAIVMFSALFAIDLLGFKSPQRRYYFLTAIVVMGLTTAMLTLFGYHGQVAGVARLSGLIAWTGLMVVGIGAYLEGRVYGAYYSLGCSGVLLTAIPIFLSLSGTIPFRFEMFLSIQLACSSHIIFCAFALAAKYRSIEAEGRQALIENKAQLSFFMTMVHDLRMPMSSFLGLTGLLAARLNEQGSLQYTRMIREGTNKALTIIEEMIDYLKIETGKMEVEISEFDPRLVVAGAVDVFHVKMLTRPGLEVIAEIEADVPALVRGDPALFGHVIVNLIGNALKSTESGVIYIRLYYENREKDLLRLSVQDSGTGVSQAEQKSLAEYIQQTDQIDSANYAGSGLGLSISRKLTELMGGDFGIRSSGGDGAERWFNLRLPEVQESPVQDSGLLGKRLMLITDNDGLGSLLEKASTGWGMHTLCTANFRDGKRIADENAAKQQPFDLIAVDLGAGSGDYISALRHLRALQKDSKLVFLSHQISDQNSDNIVEIAEIQSKPMVLDDYWGIFKSALDSNSIVGESVEKIGDSDFEASAPLNILVAEDNAFNQLVIRGLLNKSNHTITIAENGEEAIQKVKETDSQFDAVLMDCEMPIMDGYTATKYLRDWEDSHQKPRTPVIALSAHILPEQKETCFEAGMDELITKPIEIDKLNELLHQAIADNHT